MALAKIGAALALDGAQEFRSQIAASRTSIKEFKSEIKLIESESKGSANSLDALTKKGAALEKQYAAQKTVVETYRKAVDSASTVEEKAAKRVSDLEKALAEAETEMSRMEKTSGTTSDELDTQQKTIDELKQELSKATQEYNKAESQTSKWQTGLNNAETELNNLDEEIKTNAKYLDEAKSSTDGTAKSINEYGEVVETASDKTSVFGDVLLANLASELLIAGVQKLASGIKQLGSFVIETGMEFEYSMSNVQALMGATEAEMQSLTETAKYYGQTTRFSASEAADAIGYMALAGWSAEEAIDGLGGVLQLAIAGNMDLARASDTVTDYLSAFSMEANEAARVADVMAYAQANSNTSAVQLADAYLNVASNANAMGYDIEEATALISAMADQGLKGSRAGTQLSAVFRDLTNNMESGKITINGVSIAVSDLNGDYRSMAEIVREIEIATDGMGTAERSAALSAVFTANSISAVNKMLVTGSDKLAGFTEELYNSGGAAEEMAAIMEDNLKGRVTELGSATEALGLTIYDKFELTFKSAVETAIGSVTKLNNELSGGRLGDSVDNLANSFGNAAEGALAFGEKALPVLIDGLAWVLDNGNIVVSVFGAITAALVVNKVIKHFQDTTTVLGGAVAAFKAYKTATEGATVAQVALSAVHAINPIGLVVTAIAALTAGLGIYALTTNNATDATEKLNEQQKDFIANSESTLQQLNNSISTRREAIGAIDGEIASASALTDKLYDLANAEYVSNISKEEMSYLVGELNSRFPELGLAIDETTWSLNLSRDAVNEYLAAYEKQSKQLTVIEMVTDATDNLARAEVERESIVKQLMAAEEDLRIATNELVELEADHEAQINSFSGSMKEFADQFGDYDEVLQQATDSVEMHEAYVALLKEQLCEADEAVGMLSGDLQSYNEILADYEEQAASAVDATNEMNTYFIEFGNTVYEVSESAAFSLVSLAEEYEETRAAAEASIHSQLGLFSELDTKCETTAAQMVKNMRQQADATNQWADNLKLAAERGIDQGLIKELAAAGPTMAGYLHNILNDNTTTVDQINDAYLNKLKAEKYASEEMANVQMSFSDSLAHILADTGAFVVDMTTAGSDTASGFGQGYRATFNQIKDTFPSSANEMVRAVKSALGINSPSRVFMDIGTNLASAMGSGYNTRFSSVKSSFVSSARELARSVKRELGINSPSRVFQKIGQFTGEGFEIGAERSLSDAKHTILDAMEDITHVSAELSQPVVSHSAGSASGSTGMVNVSEIVVEALKNINITVVSQLDKRVVASETAPLISEEIERQIRRRERA